MVISGTPIALYNSQMTTETTNIKEIIMTDTCKVYHSKNWALNSNLHFAKNLETYKPFPSNYEHVANVKCKELDHAFQFTNHFDSPWWDLPVTEKVKESRSTSVGDLVEDNDGKLWLCASLGWVEVEWADEESDPWEVHEDQYGSYLVPKAA
jgi:hypothetical protein